MHQMASSGQIFIHPTGGHLGAHGLLCSFRHLLTGFTVHCSLQQQACLRTVPVTRPAAERQTMPLTHAGQHQGCRRVAAVDPCGPSAPACIEVVQPDAGFCSGWFCLFLAGTADGMSVKQLKSWASIRF